MSGFLWHNMKTERPEDDMILAEARRHGIGDGLTVPAHLPGHAHGSVSFAWKPGAVASADALQFARMIGGPAFDAARLIAYPDLAHIGPRLTRRQREVLIWSAKGESVRRIGLRLGLRSEEHTSELQSLMRISYAV